MHDLRDPIMEKLAQYIRVGPSEQRGLFVLLLLLLILLIVRSIPPKQVFYDLNYFTIPADSVAKLEGEVFLIGDSKDSRPFSPGRKFDLNELNARTMREFGFPSSWIDSIFSYKRLYGFIRSDADLRKLTGRDTVMYAMLHPWVIYKFRSPGYERKRELVESNATKLQIDINTASAEELDALPGIGPVLASRIIKFRDALGGFSELGQLYEVYGLDTGLISRINRDLTCLTRPKPLKINMVSEQELRAHPYISRSMAGNLVNYRAQHGWFLDAESLRVLPTWKEMDIQKLMPYLDFSIPPDQGL